MDAQRHRFHEVFLLLRGRLEVVIGDAASRRRRMDPGDYLIVPAGTGHTIEDRRGSTLVIVAIDDSAIADVPGRREAWSRLTDHAPSGSFPVFAAADAHLHDPSWRNLIALRGRRTTSRLERETALSAFMVHLERVATNPKHPDARERARVLARAITDRVHERWSVDAAAAAVNLSRRRFSDVWRAEHGRSFVVWLQHARVAAAQTLMSREDHSIVGAAFAAGFNDLANFYRVFRRCSGTTPGAWLEEHGRD